LAIVRGATLVMGLYFWGGANPILPETPFFSWLAWLELKCAGSLIEMANDDHPPRQKAFG